MDEDFAAEDFSVLKCLVGQEKLSIGVNPFRANTPGSPGYRGYENSLAMWGTITAVVFVFVGYGWLIGLFLVPVGIAVFLVVGRVVQNRAGSRTRRWALSSASHFLSMWEGGVISVRDTQSGQAAISERGDALADFVRVAANSRAGPPAPQ